MTEQTRSITEAVIAKNREDRIFRMKKQRSENYLKGINLHLKRLRSLHLYGTTEKEIAEQRNDPYFSTWFRDAENGDVHTMHSILDHFEPLEIITNMGHNYRSRFSSDSALIILDFRPEDEVPMKKYSLNGSEVEVSTMSDVERLHITKSYLYSSILRIARELILYFPLSQISFEVNCDTLGMKNEKFEVSEKQVMDFVKGVDREDFVEYFEKEVLPD